MLQELSFTRTLKILFFFRQNIKKFNQLSTNYNLLKMLKVMFTEVFLEPS